MKNVYFCSIKIHALGFEELLESLFSPPPIPSSPKYLLNALYVEVSGQVGADSFFYCRGSGIEARSSGLVTCTFYPLSQLTDSCISIVC